MNTEERRRPNTNAGDTCEVRKPRRVVDVIDESLANAHREIARLLELRKNADPKVLNMDHNDLAALLYPGNHGPF